MGTRLQPQRRWSGRRARRPTAIYQRTALSWPPTISPLVPAARLVTSVLLSVTVWLSATVLLLPSPAQAQELEPRAFSNAPVNLNFVAVAYAYSTGNVALDPSLPIEGLRSTLHVVAPRYVRTLDFFGVTSKVKFLLPVATGHWEGVLTDPLPGTDIEPGFRTRDDTGLGDARFSWEVNFFGSPALGLREFASYRQRTILGAGIQVIMPTGHYDNERLINLGSNRWAFRPQIGISQAVGRWTFEATATAWIFTDNNEYFGNLTLEQDSILALQGHVIYTIRPGFWIAVDAGVLDGGTTRIDGVVRNTLQRNSRAGLTLVYPLARQHGISVAYSRGVTTRIGADFRTFAVAYQYMWGGGL